MYFRLFCVCVLGFADIALIKNQYPNNNKMNWKDLALIFLVVVAASVAYDKGIKALLEPKAKASEATT